jgi:hypothetical protein
MSIRKQLLSVAPETMEEDEHKIADGYRTRSLVYLGFVPLILAFFFELKFVVAAGIVIAVLALNDISARLYDLCIRLRRTNVLLNNLSKRQIQGDDV